MKITKSDQVLVEKPLTGKSVGKIKSSVVNVTQIKLEDLKDIVLKNPFNVSEAKGIEEGNWISQQIFALDFDSGITPTDIIKRCIKLSFTPNIIYSTFSDTEEKRKFRVLFILQNKVTEYKTAKYIQKGLMKLFPESDKACKDLCRMYYPGREIIHYIEEPNDDFFNQLCLSQVATNEVFFDKFEYNDAPRPDIIKNYNWERASKEIKILDIFFNQEYRVSYEILFALMTNAQYIEGGQAKILNRMKEINSLGGALYFPDIKRGIETYPKDYFISLSPKAIRRYNYMPTQLQNFSPFPDDADFKNLLEIRHKKGHIEILEQQKLISLGNAEKLLKDAYRCAKDDIPFNISYSNPDMITGESYPYIHKLDPLFNQLPENPIYIFKITTGAGKSQAFIQEREALIALPFHRLKDEMSDRMLVTHKVTPEPPEFSDIRINDCISELRDADLYSEVTSIIKSISTGSLKLNKISIDLTDEDILTAKSFISINEDCRRDTTTVLTTHTRAISDLSFKHKFYIFDEDPLNDLVSIESIEIQFSEFDNSQYKSFIECVENYLRSIPLNALVHLPRFKKPAGFDKYCASIKKGKVIKLLNAEIIYRDEHNSNIINFCTVKEFLKNKKIFIMSATIPIPIYKKLFGERVIVIDITNIKPMGVIEQYTKRSFSSTGMAHYNTKVYNELFNRIQGTKVITHMKESPKFKNFIYLDSGTRHHFYFGNCSGGDILNGYDVSVIGTPNKPEFVYLFYAELLKLPNSINQNLYDRIVEWNGFRFRFFTYEDPTLRDIQLSLIEAELLQAAGRSRFLRNKNCTKIFSSLPLKITTTFYEN